VAVAVAVAVALALGIGLASPWRRTAAPDPAAPHPTAPAPAPAPGTLGRLAFGLDGDVYVADWDGTNRVRIADGEPATENDCANYWSEGPVWSPDGRYLVYRGDGVSHTTSTGCPWSEHVNISDTSGRRIASFPGEGWQVAWSPDSSRVALWVDFGDTLGIYGLDGVRQALLTVPSGGGMAGDFDPVWSPDGASLLLRGGVEVPVDGSAPRQLPSDDPRSQLQFAYSPDGADIAYVSKDGLAVAAADGSRDRMLVASDVAPLVDWWFGPAWSPSGDRIAFVYQPGGDPADEGSTTELAVVDVASGTVTSLADLGRDADAAYTMLTFSPEGDKVLLTRVGASGARSLWSVRADGSESRRLVAGSSWGDWQTVTPQR
jgi:Tol biopolymer transport system component